MFIFSFFAAADFCFLLFFSPFAGAGRFFRPPAGPSLGQSFADCKLWIFHTFQVLADFSGHLHCSLSSLRRSFADLAAAVIFLHCKCTNWNIVTSFIMWIFREVVKNMIICVMKRILHKNKVIFIQLQQFPILSYCLLLLCHKLVG